MILGNRDGDVAQRMIVGVVNIDVTGIDFGQGRVAGFVGFHGDFQFLGGVFFGHSSVRHPTIAFQISCAT